MKIGDRIPLTETEQSVVKNITRRVKAARTLMMTGAREEQDAQDALAKFINEGHPELSEWQGMVSEDEAALILIGPHNPEIETTHGGK